MHEDVLKGKRDTLNGALSLLRKTQTCSIVLMGYFTANAMHVFKHTPCKAKLDIIRTFQRTGLARKGEESTFLCCLFGNVMLSSEVL